MRNTHFFKYISNERGTWAMIGSSALSAGASIGGSLLSKGLNSKGTPAQLVTTNPYDQMQQGGQGGNFSDLANTNSTYLADMFSQLGTGQAPSYYQSYQNQAMPYFQNLLNQQYYGTPGNRMANGAGGPSGMGDAMTMAAMFGLNPKATTGLVNKNNLAYQNYSNQLDQYLAGQGLDIMNNTARNLPGYATGQQNSLTEAFRPTVSPIAGTPGGNQGNSLFGALGQSGLFNSIGSGISSFFGGGGGGGGMSSNVAFPSGAFSSGMPAFNANTPGLTFAQA